jgi:hypothetical protein
MTELVDARDVEPDAIGKIVDGKFEGVSLTLIDPLDPNGRALPVHDVVKGRRGGDRLDAMRWATAKHEREEPIGFNIYRDGQFVQHVNFGNLRGFGPW